MKQAFLLMLVFFLSTYANAQKKTFLRIYDNRGKKTAAGYFAGSTDSSLQLSKDDSVQMISFADIGTIKTKRTIGHTVAMVAGTTTVVMTVLLVAGSGGSSWLTWTAAEGARAGATSGILGGTLFGIIAAALKNSKTYTIKGDYNNWLKVKPVLDKVKAFRHQAVTTGN